MSERYNERIIAMSPKRRASMTAAQIAAEVGCNARWVRRVLKAAGLNYFRPGPGRPRKQEASSHG